MIYIYYRALRFLLLFLIARTKENHVSKSPGYELYGIPNSSAVILTILEISCK